MRTEQWEEVTAQPLGQPSRPTGLQPRDGCRALGLGSARVPALLDPVLAQSATSVNHPITSRRHWKNFALTSRTHNSPTGFTIWNLRQGSHKGGSGECGITDLTYRSTKLGRFSRPWGSKGATTYTIPTFRAGEREPPLQPRFKMYILFSEMSFHAVTLVKSFPVAPPPLDRETGFWSYPAECKISGN